jgi:hypothetical protein
MTYTFDENIVSDLHKEAYGFRPTASFWSTWESSNDDQKQSEWDDLICAMEESMEQEKEQQAQALVNFRKLLKTTMTTCNVDWKNALRILMEADTEFTKDSQEFDYFLWSHDLGYEKRKEIYAKFVG